MDNEGAFSQVSQKADLEVGGSQLTICYQHCNLQNLIRLRVQTYTSPGEISPCIQDRPALQQLSLAINMYFNFYFKAVVPPAYSSLMLRK